MSWYLTAHKENSKLDFRIEAASFKEAEDKVYKLGLEGKINVIGKLIEDCPEQKSYSFDLIERGIAMLIAKKTKLEFKLREIETDLNYYSRNREKFPDEYAYFLYSRKSTNRDINVFNEMIKKLNDE